MRPRRLLNTFTDVGLAFIAIVGFSFLAWAFALIAWAVEHVHAS